MAAGGLESIPATMPAPNTEEFLILTKTYPSPSAKYRELRRLFPVPYRLLAGKVQFQKWEWVRARVSRSDKDHRPESHRIDTDSIVRTGKKISTKGGDWSERLKWIRPHTVESFSKLETRRQATGQTLGFIRPSRIVRFEITPVKN